MELLRYEDIDLSQTVKRSEEDVNNVLDIVSDILKNVRQNKDQALKDYTQKFDKVIIAYEESALGGENSVLSNVLNNIEPSQKILFVFGPEGGLSGSEIDLFTSNGGICAGLGPRIMRAETAPIYALSAVSYALELNS